ISSIFSTQNRQTFLRRKYCFFWVATALSPPVGRCDALPGLPLDSAMAYASFGRPGRGAPGVGPAAGGSVIACAREGCAGTGTAGAFRARLAARLSRSFLDRKSTRLNSSHLG